MAKKKKGEEKNVADPPAYRHYSKLVTNRKQNIYFFRPNQISFGGQFFYQFGRFTNIWSPQGYLNLIIWRDCNGSDLQFYLAIDNDSFKFDCHLICCNNEQMQWMLIKFVAAISCINIEIIVRSRIWHHWCESIKTGMKIVYHFVCEKISKGSWY